MLILWTTIQSKKLAGAQAGDTCSGLPMSRLQVVWKKRLGLGGRVISSKWSRKKWTVL